MKGDAEMYWACQENVNFRLGQLESLLDESEDVLLPVDARTLRGLLDALKGGESGSSDLEFGRDTLRYLEKILEISPDLRGADELRKAIFFGREICFGYDLREFYK